MWLASFIISCNISGRICKSSVHTQRFAERVHDKFREIDEKLSSGPKPGTVAGEGSKDPSAVAGKAGGKEDTVQSNASQDASAAFTESIPDCDHS